MKQKPIRCPYCGSTAILKDASYVYGSKSKGGKVYVCSRYPECNSYVGVHPGTNIAKGTLADKQLRFKRIQAHQTLTRSGRTTFSPNQMHTVGLPTSFV